MSMRYFGTDGVRGRVGTHPMTVEFALRLAGAAARVLAPDGRPRAGRQGHAALGLHVRGGARGRLRRGGRRRAARGTAADARASPISCSGSAATSAPSSAPRTTATTTTASSSSTARAASSPTSSRRRSRRISTSRRRRANRASSAAPRASTSERALYQAFCASTLPRGMRLDGLKLVIDCANGAAYKVAPRVLADLGAEIVPIGCSPNGRNINDGCGSTDPGLLKLTVAGVRADAGIALDGDGDRLVMADHLGRTVDGDQLLYVLARARLAAGDLKGPVVGTVMTQSRARARARRSSACPSCARRSATATCCSCCARTRACWAARPRATCWCLDKATTGDGLIVALQVLAVMKSTGKSLAELAAGHAALSAAAHQRARGEALRCGTRADGGGGDRARRTARSASAAAWCCAPRAPSR